MGGGWRAELGMAMAWLVFPLVPVLLEDFYYQVCVNLIGTARSGPEPRDWGWSTWLLMLGPLLGYGFLAGSTAEVADDVGGPKRGVRRVAARRAVWVAIGPWAGFLLVVGAFFGLGALSRWFPANQGKVPLAPSEETLASRGLSSVFAVIFVWVWAYAWLWPAWASLERAGRIGLWRRAMHRGIITAMAFVGSLFGSFWAITSAWRGFFFDPRIMPMIAMALGAVMLSGCAARISYGEMRRRELFHAMLLAWVFGLALIWWWSSRRRSRSSRRGDSDRGGPRSS